MIETGGILVGWYTETLDCAMVMHASEEPADSRKGRTCFHRGVAGLQQWLQKLWCGKRRHYYLGEWHFHPAGASLPSGTDISEMKSLSKSMGYHCPEPLLIIIGGNPPSIWEMRVFVFPRESEPLELRKVGT